MSSNFQHQNLQGRSFQGQDLSGANFSYADIRGTNFASSILTGANFSHARAGISLPWKIGLGIASLPLMLLASTMVVIAGTWILVCFDPRTTGKITVLPGFFTLLLLAVFTLGSLRQKFKNTIAILGVLYLSIVVISVQLGISFAVLGFGRRGIAIALIAAIWGLVSMALTIGAFLAFALVVAGAGSNHVVANWLWILGIAKALSLTSATLRLGMGTFLFSEGISLLIAVAAGYAGRQAALGNDKYRVIREIVAAIIARRGTSFQGADLTDATFTLANLENANFREANLTRTDWYKARKLYRAYRGKTYLQNPIVLQLVNTKQGSEGNFNGQDLKGLNLQEANLANASLIGVNLCQTNLQAADLSGAILERSQLREANLTGAILTGACIENSEVTETAKLDGIVCKYVYLKFIDGDKRERIPSVGEFEADEFIDFMLNQEEELINVERKREPRSWEGAAELNGTVSSGGTEPNEQLLSSMDSLPGERKFSRNYQIVLRKLEKAIATELLFDAEDKKEAMEQVQVLVEAWQNSEDREKRRRGNEAIQYLKGMSGEFPDGAEFSTACSQLLPAIATLLNK